MIIIPEFKNFSITIADHEPCFIPMFRLLTCHSCPATYFTDATKYDIVNWEHNWKRYINWFGNSHDLDHPGPIKIIYKPKKDRS